MEKENFFLLDNKFSIIYVYERYEGNFKDGKKEGDFKLIYGNG